ncbi:type VI secretion system protein TssA [Erwinia billingiae]|uniref:type VI secretion system protein TssA n=1 Tax=Erwinia billingiae TaxID=182337 RepID=UPI00320979A7
MASLQTLITTCTDDPAGQQALLLRASADAARWDKWLSPISDDSPVGDDPGYDDDFQQMREEINKLSGIDTGLMCELAERLICTRCKDVRVATWYIWARLHRDGESGLAEGLSLLAAMVKRFGDALLPARTNSRKMAAEWLGGGRFLDSLSLYPEVDRTGFERIVAALALLDTGLQQWQENSRPGLGGLYQALENRLVQSGGLHSVVPQNSRPAEDARYGNESAPAAPAPQLKDVQSGRDLLDQARLLVRFLNEQPLGWLSGHHLMKSLRWDTVHELPPLDASGRTRLVPPRTDYCAQLKRLYLQQSWQELMEQAGSMFGEGVNHLWLDLQWYLHQALSRCGAPYDGWADIIREDVRLFLLRLPGFETLAYNDGTPFADEVTLNWINQQIRKEPGGWMGDTPNATPGGNDDDILGLESEALAQADADGIEAALGWLQLRPGITSVRQKWLLRLLMARIAEQHGKNDMALHLLSELLEQAGEILLPAWEPQLIFEARARSLKLLRIKASRSESDKTRLAAEMDRLLAGLIAIDPARAMVLCS